MAVITGTPGNDNLVGGAETDQISGGGGDDTLYDYNAPFFEERSPAFDILDGGDGNDRLIVRGGSGSSVTLIGGNGDDMLYGLDVGKENYGAYDPGAHIFDGGAGNDTIAFKHTFQSLDGGAGIDTVIYWSTIFTRYGPAVPLFVDLRANVMQGKTISGIENVTGFFRSDDVLLGDDGDNILDGGGSSTGVGDTLAGRGGNDTLIGRNGRDTLDGDEGNDVLYGGTNNDTLRGGAGDDILYGEDGDDLLVGGANDGVDRMFGGFGNDFYAIDNAASSIVELVNQGTDTVQTNLASYVLTAHVENLLMVGAAQTGVGNDLANLIQGTDGANTLFGEGGVDTLIGLNGDDFLIGGTGIDYMTGGAGNDTYWVDETNDRTTEITGEGTDVVYSAASAFELTANVEHAVLFNGASVLVGNSLNNWVAGNSGDNTILGQAGSDTLIGDAGDDSLYGGDGDDFLWGGVGVDAMFGGQGADIFHFGSSAEGGAVLQDFSRLEGDRIGLNGELFGLSPGAGLSATAFVSGASMPVPTSGNATILYSTTQGTLFWDPDGFGAATPIYLGTLNGIPELHSGDFFIY